MESNAAYLASGDHVYEEAASRQSFDNLLEAARDPARVRMKALGEYEHP